MPTLTIRPLRSLSYGLALSGLCLLTGCPDAKTVPPRAAGDATAEAPASGAPETELGTPASPTPPENAATPPAPQSAETPPAMPANSGTPASAPPAITPPAASPPATSAVVLPEVPDPATVPYFNPIDKARAQEGWISLFDGHSLMGWQRHADGANWSVREGVITADTGPVDLLCTTVPFADYELEVDFRMEAGGNSGVFLRTDDRPGKVDADCFEVNIADAHPQGFTTGALVGRLATAQPITGSGDWKTFRINAEGNHITIYLDGNLVLDYTDESATPRRSGLIGLQKNQGKIEFRNIVLRPLSEQPLFNGQDLAGWRVVPGKSEFTVADGLIQVHNGRGFLETEGAWADFVFQAESRTNAPALNSGYFFRAPAIEDEGNCNGYEAQIQNAFVDGDRKQPADYGTGAIYRRVKARYVVPNDGEWFTSTVIAYGPRIATWVDGYQVVDWVDERPAAENPRNGLWTQAGHIALQGHDPTTDLSFRNLRIAELPAR